MASQGAVAAGLVPPSLPTGAVVSGASMSLRLPWFPKLVADWRHGRKVRSMTWEERGIFDWLLCEQWADGPLPADPAEVARIIGAPVGPVERVLTLAFDRGPDGWTNGRLEEIRAEQEAAHTKKVLAGSLGGQARDKHRSSDAQAALKQRSSVPPPNADAESDAEPTPRARKARGGKIRQPHAWHQNPRFRALMEKWPENRRGNREEAFACWEGQGDEGKRNIETRLLAIVSTCSEEKLGAFSTLLLDAVHAPYTPHTNGAEKTERCGYCDQRFPITNGALGTHRVACLAARKALA